MIINLDGKNNHYKLVNETAVTFKGDVSDEILIEIENCKELEIQGNFNNVDVKVVILNISNNNIKIKENYQVQNSSIEIAYGNFSKNDITLKSQSSLNSFNSAIKYHTYSLVKKSIDMSINIINVKGNSHADMYNYAVCLKDSNLDVVASGKINRGALASKNHQTSKCLTFDALNRVNVLPELLIDENDVEASHALSIGQMNENQLFYLQSRGLSSNEISKLITVGYVMPISRLLNNENLNKIISEKVESKVSELCWM